MSEDNQTGWDQLSEHGSTGCVVIVALLLAFFMPWIIVLYVLGFVIWAGLKYAEYRQNQQKRNDET